MIKQLYLYKNHYNWQDKISNMTQSVFDKGHKVGEFAQSLFPNGTYVKSKDPRASANALEDTIYAIEDVQTKFTKQPSFIIKSYSTLIYWSETEVSGKYMKLKVPHQSLKPILMISLFSIM